MHFSLTAVAARQSATLCPPSPHPLSLSHSTNITYTQPHFVIDNKNTHAHTHTDTHQITTSGGFDADQCWFNEFRCGNGECIPMRQVCDNIYDCNDYTDEQSCGKLLVASITLAITVSCLNLNRLSLYVYCFCRSLFSW